MFNQNNKRFLYIAGGVFVLFVIIILVFAITARNKGTQSSTTNGTLTVWEYADDTSAYSVLDSTFESNHKGIKVNIVKKDMKDYLNASVNEIAAGKGPDVWAVPNDWMVAYHDKMVPMPDGKLTTDKKRTDAEVYKGIYPGVAATDNIFDNKVYGMPLSIDTLSLYYNVDILGKKLNEIIQGDDQSLTDTAQPLLNNGPKNWDELVYLSRLLTNKSGNDVSQAGITLGTSGITNANDILTLIMLQNGAKMTSDDNSSAQFHTAQNVFSGVSYPGTKALDFFTSFAKSGNDNYAWNDSLGDSLRAFAEGKAAMFIGYSSQEQDIKRINPNLNYNIINVPQIKETKNPVNFASYTTYTVTKAAKDQNLAWDFVLSLQDQNNVNAYLAATKKPPALSESLNTDNDQSPTARNWYKPDPQKTNDIFATMIKQVNDGKNAQTAIENAASQVTTLLQQLK